MATTGKVRTVLKDIGPCEVGVTMTHEHLCIDARPLGPAPNNSWDARPFVLQHRDWIQRRPYEHEPNLVFNDDDVRSAVEEELLEYREQGGTTIVENTTCGIARDVTFLRRLSLATGVHIVAGAGYYIASSQKVATLTMTTERLAISMKAEVTEGCDGTLVRCGVLGELGSAWPIQPFEKRVLEAAAIVHEDVGCPVITHPGRHREAPFEVLRLFLEAGGKADRLVMAHLDRTFALEEDFLEFATTGAYSELDLFGVECSYYALNEDFDMPSDAQRIRFIKALIEDGRQDKIVIAHDIHTKHRLVKYGGHGFSHILKHVVPTMRRRDVTQEHIDMILVSNPRAWLTF